MGSENKDMSNSCISATIYVYTALRLAVVLAILLRSAT